PGADAASGSLATERATVEGDPARADTAALASAVAAAGYELAEAPAPVAPGAAPDDREQAARAAEQRRLRARVLVGVVLSIPIVLGSMREIFPWAPRSEEPRLNSSHQIISYAVFCLKNKKA